MDTELRGIRRTRRALEWVTVGAVFLTPLTVNPFITFRCGRVKDAAMWTLAAAAAWFLAALWSARPGLMSVPSRLARPSAFWLAAVLLSVAAAASKPLSVWAAMSLAPPIVLALSIGVVARKAAARRRLMAAWVASAGICSAYAVAQHYGLDVFRWSTVSPAQRVVGTIGAPIYLGAFLAMALPLATALARTRRCPKWVPAAAVVIIVALALTYSRAAWLAGAAGILVTMYASTARQARKGAAPLEWAALPGVLLLPLVYLFARPLMKPVGAVAAVGILAWAASAPGYGRARKLLAAGAVLAALLMYADVHRHGSAISQRITNAAGKETEAVVDRRIFWQDATTLIQKRPWLGWGPDGFRAGAPTVARDRVIASSPLLYPHANAHSEWYTAAVDGGVLGLVAWLAVVLGLLSVAADRARLESGRGKSEASPVRAERAALAAGAFGSLVAFALQGCLTPRATVTSLGLALLWGLVASFEPTALRRVRSPRWALQGSAVVFCAVAAVCAISITAADLFADRAQKERDAAHATQALALYRSAAAAGPMEPGYRAALAEYALKIAASERGIAAASAALDAEQAFAANVAAEPRNGLWRAGRARALSFTAPAEAVAEGQAATKLSPMSAWCWWSLAIADRAAGARLEEKDAIRTSIYCEPIDPSPFLRLAEIFREQREPWNADYLLTRAAEAYPDSPSLDRWRRSKSTGGGAPAPTASR